MAKKHDLQAVLKIGDRLFRRQGFHQTGTDEILQEAAFPRSSFYYHFKSKEGFGLKTLAYYGRANRTYLEQILLDELLGSPLERLQQYFMSMVEISHDQAYQNCCLIQRFSMEAAGEPGPIQEAARLQFAAWVDVSNQCVAAAQQAGEIKSDFSPTEVSHFLFSQLYGMFSFARLNRDVDQYRRQIEMALQLIQA
ncbi:MAG: TetR/AcrR family transcriptional regulator [Bacteroidota bacterium]